MKIRACLPDVPTCTRRCNINSQVGARVGVKGRPGVQETLANKTHAMGVKTCTVQFATHVGLRRCGQK